MQRRTLLLSPVTLAAGCATPEAQRPPEQPWPPAPGTQRAVSLALPGLNAPVRCWFYEPVGYAPAGRPWPLVVFLHGSGECGLELDRVAAHGPPKLARAGQHFPFLLCSPQLDEEQEWDPQMLHALLGQLRRHWHVDAARVVGTGLSLGGGGVWSWAAQYPQDLAAIAPVCGYADAQRVCGARQVPVRAYHGDRDDAVPLALQQQPVAALRACGGTAELIVYPGVGHDAWNPAYADPALVPWMMAQVRR